MGEPGRERAAEQRRGREWRYRVGPALPLTIETFHDVSTNATKIQIIWPILSDSAK